MYAASTLFLTSSYPRFPGDYAGNFVAEMARIYRARGDVAILAPDDRLVDPDYDRDGIRVFRFAPRLRKTSGPFYDAGGPENLTETERLVETPYSAWAMLAEAKRMAGRFNRLVAHWLVPSGFVGASLRAPGKPLQLIVHGGGWHFLKRRFWGRMTARWILSRADDIITVAPYLREEILGLYKSRERDEMAGRIRSIPMGLDVSRYSQRGRARRRTDGERRVLAVGRMTPIKGFDRLIEACAPLGAELLLAGDGPMRSRLTGLAARRGVSLRCFGNVAREKLAELYRTADVLAFSSRRLGGREEGTPRVLLEGMAAGSAIAATRTGGVGHILKDGWNCLISDDDVEGLRRNIGRLLDSPKLGKRLGEQAAEDVRQYDWTRLKPEFLKPYYS